MANLQANLRSQYASLAALKEFFPLALEDFEHLFVSVNRLFYENSGDSSYATLFFADYDDTSRRLCSPTVDTFRRCCCVTVSLEA